MFKAPRSPPFGIAHAAAGARPRRGSRGPLVLKTLVAMAAPKLLLVDRRSAAQCRVGVSDPRGPAVQAGTVGP